MIFEALYESARQTGRRAVGIELSERYCTHITERLEGAV
jgi:DNA modification methylase